MHHLPHSKKRVKPLWRYGLALVALLAILLVWSPWKSSHPENARFDIVPVTRDDMEETVTAQGKLEPKQFVDVGAQVSGQLQKLHVAIGDPVQKGDLIAEIDPKIYTAKVAADEAGLNSLKAQLAEQQAQVAFTENVYKRSQKLIKAEAVSRETLEANLKEFKAAKARSSSFTAQIKQAESTLQADRANLGYTKIYAPITGTVVSQTSKEGQTLNANQTAPVIVQVANLDIMTVRAQVAEADVSRLQVGMDVYFNTLGSERRWESTLRQLLPSPDSTITDVVLYNALVDVENPDHALMTGMSTQMFFLLGSAKQALVIPARALGKKLPAAADTAGESYEVQVETKDGLHSKPVRIGLLNRTQAQVLSGLGETDRVAVPKTITPDAAAPNAKRMPRM